MSFNQFRTVIEAGDTVLLYISVSNLYALEVKPTILNKKKEEVENVFQTQYGCLKVMDLVGQKYGSKVSLSKGWAHVLYPTPELWTITLPHRTQILYTPDISMILMELDIGPGSVVCEAGTGSGSLSHAFLRTIGKSGHLHTCDFHQNRVELATEEFSSHGLGDRVSVSCRDVCVDGWGIDDRADAVFLDLPNPWLVLPHAIHAIKTKGGRICSFSPCIEQVMKTCEFLQNLDLKEITTLECLQREFQVRTITCASILPSIQDSNAENTNKESQKKKAKLDLDTAQNGNSDTTIHKEEKSINNHRFKSAVPLLKMTGHTGYLTFATVPPKLSKKKTTILNSSQK